MDVQECEMSNKQTQSNSMRGSKTAHGFLPRVAYNRPMFESYRKERAAVVVVGLPSLSCLNPPVTAKLSVSMGYPNYQQ